MDGYTRTLPTRLKAIALGALLALAATMVGLSLASTGGGDRADLLSNGSAAERRSQLSLGDRQVARHRARPGLQRGRATTPARATLPPAAADDAPAPSPQLATAAPTEPAGVVPAPAAPPAAATPKTSPPPVTEPGQPAPPASTPDPPVTEPPSPPVTEPPSEPVPEPPPSGPDSPPKAPAEVDPGVPVEPEPTPGTAPLVIGIDGHYSGWNAAEIRHRTALGAPVTRHEWDTSNPVSSEEEQMLAAATEIHTRVLALLGGNQLGDATEYRDWVVGFLGYYGPGGIFWRNHPGLDEARYAVNTIELGNEPYFGEMSPEQYADTVRPTLESVRDLGLPVKVILPAYLHGENTNWIDTLYERIPNLNSLFYSFAFHPYWYGHDPSEPGDSGGLERIETLRQRMNALGAGSKPIYLTEYGESTANCGEECVSEAVQAEHLQEMIEAVVTHPAWKVELLSLFQLLDRGTNSSDRELQFGLLREDGTPKPAYAIVRAAMQLYR